VALALDLPNLLSLARLPLAAVPWCAPGSVPLLLSTVAVAALTDVLDGLLARRAARTRSIGGAGAWLDPACDKVFVLSTLTAVATATGPPASTLALIALRELLLLPLLVALAVIARRGARPDLRANLLGKATTGAQLLAVLALALGRGEARALAAGSYAARALGWWRARRGLSARSGRAGPGSPR
jgi:cardiolipin synthase